MEHNAVILLHQAQTQTFCGVTRPVRQRKHRLIYFNNGILLKQVKSSQINLSEGNNMQCLTNQQLSFVILKGSFITFIHQIHTHSHTVHTLGGGNQYCGGVFGV